MLAGRTLIWGAGHLGIPEVDIFDPELSEPEHNYFGSPPLYRVLRGHFHALVVPRLESKRALYLIACLLECSREIARPCEIRCRPIAAQPVAHISMIPDCCSLGFEQINKTPSGALDHREQRLEVFHGENVKRFGVASLQSPPDSLPRGTVRVAASKSMA